MGGAMCFLLPVTRSVIPASYSHVVATPRSLNEIKMSDRWFYQVPSLVHLYIFSLVFLPIWEVGCRCGDLLRHFWAVFKTTQMFIRHYHGVSGARGCLELCCQLARISSSHCIILFDNLWATLIKIHVSGTTYN